MISNFKEKYFFLLIIFTSLFYFFSQIACEISNFTCIRFYFGVFGLPITNMFNWLPETSIG